MINVMGLFLSRKIVEQQDSIEEKEKNLLWKINFTERKIRYLSKDLVHFKKMACIQKERDLTEKLLKLQEELAHFHRELEDLQRTKDLNCD